MAKQGGLGDNFYDAGVDLSGDVGSITLRGGPRPLPKTGIDVFAWERNGGVRDGAIRWKSWFNPTRAHPQLKLLPTADVILTYCRGTALGSPAAAIVAKQANYDGERGDDGSFAFQVEGLGALYGLEWCEQLTGGRDTLGGAGAGSGLDYGVTIGQTLFGLQAYLHVFAFTGTSATVAVQHSSDNGAGDPYADVAGGAFAAASAVGAQRIETARTATVKRWLRVNVTGTFSNLDFAVAVAKNVTSAVF